MWPLYRQPDNICKLKAQNWKKNQRVLALRSIQTKPSPKNLKSNDPIILRGQEIEGVNKFVYLAATITPEGGGIGDLKNRIVRAHSTFNKLGKMWNSNKNTTTRITRKTKTRLFKTIGTPVLLYGCETWKMNKGNNKLIDTFQNKCLRKILKIRWEDHISDGQLNKRSGIKPVKKLAGRGGNSQATCRGKTQRMTAKQYLAGLQRGGESMDGQKQPGEGLQRRKFLGYNTWAETRVTAANKKGWRCSVEALCATSHEDDNR